MSIEYDIFQGLGQQMPHFHNEDSVLGSIHRSGGESIENEVTFTAAGATTNIFSFNVPIRILLIGGTFMDVTDTTSCAAASLNAFDGANTVQITSAAGTDCSGAGIGSVMVKTATNATAITFLNSTQVRINEPNSLFQVFRLVPMQNTVCYIRFVYTSVTTVNFKIKFRMIYDIIDHTTADGQVLAV